MVAPGVTPVLPSIDELSIVPGASADADEGLPASVDVDITDG
jgi:hypothetical protein